MKAEEKAKDLFVRIYELIPDYVIEENKIASELAKQCALVCVDEILDILENKLDFKMIKSMTYWSEIKQEIELI
ncbi:MAG: hypothetical protein ACYC5G_04700 [Candidatus Doudnabacteria bacterium]